MDLIFAVQNLFNTNHGNLRSWQHDKYHGSHQGCRQNKGDIRHKANDLTNLYLTVSGHPSSDPDQGNIGKAHGQGKNRLHQPGDLSDTGIDSCQIPVNPFKPVLFSLFLRKGLYDPDTGNLIPEYRIHLINPGLLCSVIWKNLL